MLLNNQCITEEIMRKLNMYISRDKWQQKHKNPKPMTSKMGRKRKARRWKEIQGQMKEILFKIIILRVDILHNLTNSLKGSSREQNKYIIIERVMLLISCTEMRCKAHLKSWLFYGKKSVPILTRQKENSSFTGVRRFVIGL